MTRSAKAFVLGFKSCGSFMNVFDHVGANPDAVEMKVRRHPQARGCKRTVFLKDEERFRLIRGPYEPPPFQHGFLFDAVRGKVRFAKYSNAPIPWPIFRKEGP